MSDHILVSGAGLAGLTCAHLLAGGGRDVVVVDQVHNPPPSLVINEITMTLLRDVWGGIGDLLEGSHPILERHVCWGPGSPLRQVMQFSAAVDGRRLMDRLRTQLTKTHTGRVRIVEEPLDRSVADLAWDGFNWVVDAAGRDPLVAGVGSPVGPTYLSFGRRSILATSVVLGNAVDDYTCWMETLPGAWVFLVPLGAERGMLQVMVPNRPADEEATIARELASTSWIRGLVRARSSPVRVFDAAPRLRKPVCGTHWLAVGDAAMRLDPVTGYGVAYSMRSAILATAVINAHGAVPSNPACLAHYQDRLGDAFLAHLEVCVRLYSAGFASQAWSHEITTMRRAVGAAQRSPSPLYRYQLEGMHLVARR